MRKLCLHLETRQAHMQLPVSRAMSSVFHRQAVIRAHTTPSSCLSNNATLLNVWASEVRQSRLFAGLRHGCKHVHPNSRPCWGSTQTSQLTWFCIASKFFTVTRACRAREEHTTVLARLKWVTNGQPTSFYTLSLSMRWELVSTAQITCTLPQGEVSMC